MKHFSILLSFFLIVTLSGCQSITDGGTPPSMNSLYFNSFETGSDIYGWDNYGSVRLDNEAPSKGGKRSLYISGGCLAPHAVLNTFSIKRNTMIKLQFFGKALQHSGSVRLENANTGKSILVSVKDTTWTHYQSPDQLYVQPGDNLRLTMSSGGIIPGSMLIDLLEITEKN